MFIRTRKGKNTTYQLCESFRQNGKPRQRVVASLGRDATPQEALKTARTWLRIYSQGRTRSVRSEERMNRQRKRVAQLEALIEKWPLRNGDSATTPTDERDEDFAVRVMKEWSKRGGVNHGESGRRVLAERCE
jgi:hypothetical protein